MKKRYFVSLITNLSKYNCSTHDAFLTRTFVIALLLFAFVHPSFGQGKRVIPGQARDYACFNYIVEAKEFVGTSRRGILHKVALRFGENKCLGRRPSNIKWEKTTSSSYVFCSKTIPSTHGYNSDGTVYSVFLEYTPSSSPPYVLTSSNNIYQYVCHNVLPKDKINIGSKYQYAVDEELFNKISKDIRKIEDLLVR